MERWNWALLGLMGIVTALGLTTSSGAGKAKTELADSDLEVVACAPLTGSVPASDAAPIEIATAVPASTHSGCSHCQAKKAAAANDTAQPTARSQAFDEFAAWVQSSIKPSTCDHAAGEACPGNCPATGVCCDKSLSKKDGVVSITRSGDVFDVVTPADKKTESGVWFDVPNSVVSKKSNGPILDLDKVVCEGECPLSKKASTDVVADCPLARAAAALSNLTKNFACEGGECFSDKGHGTLTITAVEPAPAKPEGLLNLVAAGEVAAANNETAKTITTKSENGTVTSTITITSGALDASKTGTGTLTLNVNATEQKPAAAATTLAEQFKAAEAKPAVDNSRAAARAAKLAKIEAKLEEPWTLEIDKITLEELSQAVQQKYGVPVILDRKSLEEAAFDIATPISVVKQPDIEAGEYLKGALNDLGLTWVIPASGDRVLFTTQAAMANMPMNRVYDVTDLIDENTGPEALIERIQSLVEPASWKANGGNGELTIWQKGNRVTLICSDTYWIQRAIVTLLEDLRSVQQGPDKQVGAKIDNQSSIMRRYDLPGLAHVEDVAARQKLQQKQREFLLALCQDIEGFDPAIFQTAEFGTEMLVTKQTPAVHRQIQQKLKLVTPAYPCGGSFGGGLGGVPTGVGLGK